MASKEELYRAITASTTSEQRSRRESARYSRQIEVDRKKQERAAKFANYERVLKVAQELQIKDRIEILAELFGNGEPVREIVGEDYGSLSYEFTCRPIERTRRIVTGHTPKIYKGKRWVEIDEGYYSGGGENPTYEWHPVILRRQEDVFEGGDPIMGTKHGVVQKTIRFVLGGWGTELESGVPLKTWFYNDAGDGGSAHESRVNWREGSQHNVFIFLDNRLNHPWQRPEMENKLNDFFIRSRKNIEKYYKKQE